MKLKKVVIKAQAENINNFPFGDEDRFKTCRYCRYYKCGKCYNPKVISLHTNSVDVYDVSESGSLSGVLEETMHSCSTVEMLSELTDLLEKWKVSAKRIKEFEKTFNEVLDQWLDFSLKDEIDEAVSGLYQDRIDNQDFSSGVEIENPSEYSCKEFM